MSAKPTFEFHSAVSQILGLWADDLPSIVKAGNSALKLEIYAEKIRLKAWAGIANKKANGSNVNQDSDLYFELCEHCFWRFDQLKRFHRVNRVNNDMLLKEVQLVMSWITACMGECDDS